MSKRFFNIAIILIIFLLSSCVVISRKALADEYYNIANKLYEQGSYSIATEYYQKARATSRRTNKALFNLVRIYLTQDKNTEALELALELHEIDKDNVVNKELLAYSYYEAGYPDKALAIYEELNVIVPRSRNFYNAAIIYLEKEDAETVLSLAEKATELDGQNHAALLLYAIVLQEDGQEEKALDILLSFQEVKSDPSDKSMQVAELLQKLQRYTEAREVYEKVGEDTSFDDGVRALAYFNAADTAFLKEDDSETGMNALRAAFELGYKDMPKIAALRYAQEILVTEAIDALLEEFSISLEEPSAPSETGGIEDTENNEEEGSNSSFSPQVSNPGAEAIEALRDSE